MSPAEILAYLRANGVRVWLADTADIINVQPNRRSVLTPEVCAAIRENKPALLDLLRAEDRGARINELCEQLTPPEDLPHRQCRLEWENKVRALVGTMPKEQAEHFALKLLVEEMLDADFDFDGWLHELRLLKR